MITFPVKTDKENAAVSPLFGKAKYFAFYDGKDLRVEKNPYEKGSQLVNWFLEKGVDKIVIKEMGSKPFNKVIQTNIKVLFAGEGRVTTNDVIKSFDENLLKELSPDELKNIIKEHESNKESSSCGSHSHDHNHNHDHEKNERACHKKIRAQNPYIFK
ncbi:NifB/NifX family molybdenum-iron cluster-binding protein [Halarcobacter sp.]|uniref:NifB/NifX family molybdenum-iron cluster-binding protein n=1 Tax=Halarcobacter sp. TaxID=2321133 RepID=UPI002AAB8287|nr:NifB/NifX family molybdenum-iron cluster-binding protein [Halarcobacter sp.]